MRPFKETMLGIVVLGVIALGVGFGVNAVRAKGAIKPTKDYFEMGLPAHPAAGTVQKPAASGDPTQAERFAVEPMKVPPAPAEQGRARSTEEKAAPTDTQAEGAPSGSAPGKNPDAANAETGHIKHDYQSISTKEVVAVFNDPLTAKGLNLFVDARNDQLFEEGHIPRAVQLDPYQVDQYLENVVQRANGVEKVIVYCNGGDCQDSIFACRELMLAEVPFESIYLYEGGWKAWQATEMPVSEGREE